MTSETNTATPGLREASRGEAWQPISTAPRDGTPIRVTGGGLGGTEDIATYSPRSGCWCCTYCTLDDRDDEADGYSRPTHWRPAPPTQQESGR